MLSWQLLLWLATLGFSYKTQGAHGEDREAQLGDCASILQETLPKVALLFLVRGPQPHEQLWTQWLSNLDGMIPANVQCNETAWACYKSALLPDVQRQSAYDKQQYFSIYVHTKPDYPGYPPGSIFSGRVVPMLHKTAWGSMSLVSATLELLRAALADLRNQRFQLLCEATVPVRPALFIHDQLLAESRSRVPLLQLHEGPVDLKDLAMRFPLPAVESYPALRQHARGHGQFFMLGRQHAQLLADDTELLKVFRKHCNPAFARHGHFCIPDEQYFGTLLSYKLASHQRLMSEVSSEPVLYRLKDGEGIAAEHINEEFLMEARGAVPPESVTMLPRAGAEDSIPFGRCEASERPTISVWEDNIPDPMRAQRCMDREWTYTFAADEYKVYEHCPLFLRKFKAITNETMYRLLYDMRII